MIQTITLTDNLSEKIVDIILNKFSDNPIQMAQIQIILPTKRACRSVKNAFLKQSQYKSLLLPKLIPLYELDDLSTDIPQAMTTLERTTLLAKLCAVKSNVTTPVQAIKMALGLGELLDELYQFEIPFDRLSDLVPEDIFAQHWQETVIFLDIITKAWPKILKERNLIDESDHRIRMMENYVRQIKNNDFIIAAGLDGGLPVVRRLLKTIHDSERGLVLVDGADTTLSDDAMQQLPESHYQNGIKQILTALNQKINDVISISDTNSEREFLIKETLKPEDKTEEWKNAKLSDKSLKNIYCIECSSLNDEALHIAILLRGVLENPNQTGALVTPDRDLARRVILEMKRWGILLDDSAGTPFPQTEVGIYLNLLAQLGVQQGNNKILLSLLKHPLSADGQNPEILRKLVKSAEKDARQHRTSLQIALKTDLTPFVGLFQNNVLTPFGLILKKHLEIAENLATSHDRTGHERLWGLPAGEVIFEFLTQLLELSDNIGDIEPAFYPEIINCLWHHLTVRPEYGMHPRLDILGPIEARFHHPDVCIIGGLNEGVFPTIPEVGPWLNRPMRKKIGLPAVETKTAALSMDFAHCFCSPIVYLTRSQKSDGAETIPSRFLSRLSAVLQSCQIPWKPIQSNWAKELDKPEKEDVIQYPSPKPPAEARLKSLSVTKIELLMRNPYAIYARYILRLFPLDALENKAQQQIYGTAIHKVFETFIKETPHSTDIDRLLQSADKILTESGMTDVDKAFYMPRFRQTAEFFIEQQQLIQENISHSFPEEKGSFTFDVYGKPFTLTGTIDRIDILKNGSCRIIDYKTGTVPSQKEVYAGFSPQLPLEALILDNNGFVNVPKTPINQLVYWKLAAKKEDCKVIGLNTGLLIEDAWDGLKNLIHVFNQPETPFEPCPIAGKEPTYNDYEHLARSAEWRHDEGENDGY